VKLVESLSVLRDKLTTLVQPITEDKGHLDHPEDLIFLQGSAGATQALKSTEQTIKQPKTITIKWDGYPALIFGRNDQGKFSIMDKHMFNKKDGTGRQVFSPEQFQQYDIARGVNRGDLYRLINEIWPGLEKASSGSEGYYWGDLLFSQPLEPQQGLYRFRANPNGITYTVDPDSTVGKLIAGKNAGIAVHQQIPSNAPTTDFAQPLNGTIGTLKNNSDVAIVPSAMPITPKLKLDSGLVKEVTSAIQKYGAAVDQLMDTAPQARNTFNQLFTTYINKRIISGNLDNLLQGFMDYVDTRPMTEPMRNKINAHFQQNQEGLIGAFTIWVALYKLKMSVVQQLNKAAEASPVQGYLQDGTATQEGFVANGLKFVDRMGFSRQNLAARG
jgi:hypothetical protein